MDAWIKQIRSEFSQITDVSDIVNENTGNIQHNYELVFELKDQIEALRDEVRALKLLQIISLKTKLKI